MFAQARILETACGDYVKKARYDALMPASVQKPHGYQIRNEKIRDAIRQPFADVEPVPISRSQFAVTQRKHVRFTGDQKAFMTAQYDESVVDSRNKQRAAVVAMKMREKDPMTGEIPLCHTCKIDNSHLLSI